MRRTLISLFIMSISLYMNAQSLTELPNFNRYANLNSELSHVKTGEKRVVFIGNSITEGWVGMHPHFFEENNYIGRGISGQTSPQLLLRFRQDVINLKPTAVVINIGTNDIAKNTGDYSLTFTLDNIKSMAELAQANNIKVILSAILPVGEYYWRKEIKNVPQMIDELNDNIKAYAKLKGFAYIDYNTPLKDADGAMKDGYSRDGVHPTEKAYHLMESIAKPIITEVIKK